MTAISIPFFPPIRLEKEVQALLLALLAFICFPGIARFIDPVAAPIDAGALSAVVLAIAALLCFKALTWWLIKTIWPALAQYSDNNFGGDFKALEPLPRVIIYLAFYLALFYGFIGTLAAVL